MADRRDVLKSLAFLPASALSAASGDAAELARAKSAGSTATSIFNFLPAAISKAIAAGTSDFDCAPAVRRALTQLRGGPLHFPAGRYVIGSSIKMITDVAGVPFGPGPWIIGDGIGRTRFDNRATDGPMFDVDSNADHSARFGGVLGVRMEGFSISSSARGAATTAIRLRTSYQVRLFQLHIERQGADGIRIPCLTGDNDASTMVTLENLRIENCGGWGIDTAGEPGHNETSFVRMVQVFVQNCGTPSSAAQPPSGGMRHKGQILKIDNCAFAVNANVGLYVPGQAGLAQSIEINATAFENNRQRHLLVTGISMLKARMIQFYNNDANSAKVACEFSGDRFTIRYVDIDGVTVRATAGNTPYTAFRFSGANLENDTCRVRNVVWDNFDYPGQVRFDGVHFDPLPSGGELVATDGQTLLYRASKHVGGGSHTRLRLRGKRSKSGEWVAKKLPLNGVYISNSGLEANRAYHAYLYDNDGVMALELSTEPAVVDPVSLYPVKRGDPARLHVGVVLTDAAARFLTSGSGWMNPVRIPGNMPGRYQSLWTDGQGRLRRLQNGDPRRDDDGIIID